MITFAQGSNITIVGNKTSVTGSHSFRKIFDLKDQKKLQEHILKEENTDIDTLDLSLFSESGNELEQYKNITSFLNNDLSKELMIDSIDPEVIDFILNNYNKKPIINSINLSYGIDFLKDLFNKIKDHPAKVVAMTIDENDLAYSQKEKLDIIKTIYELWVYEYKFDPSDLLVDALVLPVINPNKKLAFHSVYDTFRTIEKVHFLYDNVKTILGISNISFGINNKYRKLVDTVYFYEAISYKLDIAMINPDSVVDRKVISESDWNLISDLLHKNKDSLENILNTYPDFLD